MPPLDDEARAALGAVVAGSAPGAVIEADNLAVLDALPDGVVDLAYADPPFATGTHPAPRLDPDRPGRPDATRVPRPRVRLGGRVGPRVGRRPAARRAPRPARGARPRDPPRPRAGRLALPARGLADGPPRPAAARRGLRRGPVPQRARLGLRLRRAAPRPLAAQARHDPVVREGRPLDVRPRGHRPDPVPGARARRPGEGGPRQAAHRRVVDDDRARRRRPSGPATRPRSRSGCWSGSSRRPAGRAASCWTRTRARARPASRRRGSAGAGCSRTATRSPWRSPAAGSRRRRRSAGDGTSGDGS